MSKSVLIEIENLKDIYSILNEQLKYLQSRVNVIFNSLNSYVRPKRLVIDRSLHVGTNAVIDRTLMANDITTETLKSAGDITSKGSVTVEGSVTAGSITSNRDITSKGSVTSNGDITSKGSITSGSIISKATITARGDVTSNGDITSDGSVTAGSVTAGSITSGSIISTATITARGDVTSEGSITTESITTTGDITSDGNISAVGDIASTGRITAGSIKTTGDITSDGNISAESISSGNISSGSITSGSITSNEDISFIDFTQQSFIEEYDKYRQRSTDLISLKDLFNFYTYIRTSKKIIFLKLLRDTPFYSSGSVDYYNTVNYIKAAEQYFVNRLVQDSSKHIFEKNVDSEAFDGYIKLDYNSYYKYIKIEGKINIFTSGELQFRIKCGNPNVETTPSVIQHFTDFNLKRVNDLDNNDLYYINVESTNDKPIKLARSLVGQDSTISLDGKVTMTFYKYRVYEFDPTGLQDNQYLMRDRDFNILKSFAGGNTADNFNYTFKTQTGVHFVPVINEGSYEQAGWIFTSSTIIEHFFYTNVDYKFNVADLPIGNYALYRKDGDEVIKNFSVSESNKDIPITHVFSENDIAGVYFYTNLLFINEYKFITITESREQDLFNKDSFLSSSVNDGKTLSLPFSVIYKLPENNDEYNVLSFSLDSPPGEQGIVQQGSYIYCEYIGEYNTN